MTDHDRLNKVLVLISIILDDLAHPMSSKYDAELHATLTKLQATALLMLREKEEKNK